MKKTWTLAQAKNDFERGLLKGASIHFYEAINESDECFYTVFLESILPIDGAGQLVEARKTTKFIPAVGCELTFIHREHDQRAFKTMDAAHSAIRQIGFRPARFLIKTN